MPRGFLTRKVLTRPEPTLSSVTEDEQREWLIRFPFDYWWRKKHNVAFGSSAHREISFFDQLREFREDEAINRQRTKEDAQDDYGLMTDAYGEPLSQDEIDRDYEDLDLDDFE